MTKIVSTMTALFSSAFQALKFSTEEAIQGRATLSTIGAQVEGKRKGKPSASSPVACTVESADDTSITLAVVWPSHDVDADSAGVPKSHLGRVAHMTFPREELSKLVTEGANVIEARTARQRQARSIRALAESLGVSQEQAAQILANKAAVLKAAEAPAPKAAKVAK